MKSRACASKWKPKGVTAADTVPDTHDPSKKHALGIAAIAAAHSHDTYYAAKYCRLAARRGQIKAVVALEHAMLVAIWHMLQTGTTYSDPGDDFYARISPDKTKSRALNQLRNLGYTVTLQPTTEVA